MARHRGSGRKKKIGTKRLEMRKGEEMTVETEQHRRN